MRKSDSNRKNGHQSKGPRTPRGKSHSRRNALKHGFYSKELVISEADQPEFQNLRAGLNAQLKPSTALQELAFDSHVAWTWYGKLALRLAQRQLVRQLQYEPHENTQDEPIAVDSFIERWFVCSRSDTHAGIRALGDAMEEFNEAGYFRDETKGFLKRGFGEEYLRLLEEWTPAMSLDAMLAAEQGTDHDRMWHKTTNQPAERSSEPRETTKLVMDPKQLRHMVCKLLELRRDFLREILIITGRNTLGERPDGAHHFWFNSRLLADVNREAQRALDRFLLLKEKGL